MTKMITIFNSLQFFESLTESGMDKKIAKTLTSQIQQIQQNNLDQLATKRDVEKSRDFIKNEVIEESILINKDLKMLDQKIESVRDQLDQKIESVRDQLDQKIESLDQKIDLVRRELNAKVDIVDMKIDLVEKRLDQKIDTLEYKLTVKMGVMLTIAVGVITWLGKVV